MLLKGGHRQRSVDTPYLSKEASMKYFRALAVGLLFSGAIVAAPAAVRAEDVSITPSSWNFGEVEIGASSSVTFNASSLGPTAVWIYLVQVTPDGTDALVCGEDVSCDFSITSAPGLPLELPAGESVNMDVTFAPSAAGPSEAYLNIVTNDAGGEDDLFIHLTGVGVEPEPSDDPAAMMAALLDFFDESVAAGMLSGIGPGRSAEHRLDAYRVMLVITANLIDRKANLLACFALQVVRNKADGAPRPPDFVDGPAREGLVARIDGVRDALGCSACGRW
jgi:hypothetical protein